MNDLAGIKESDTGLSVPSLWDLPADKQALQSEEPLQVRMILYSRIYISIHVLVRIMHTCSGLDRHENE